MLITKTQNSSNMVFMMKIDKGIVPGGFWVYDKNIILNDKVWLGVFKTKVSRQRCLAALTTKVVRKISHQNPTSLFDRKISP